MSKFESKHQQLTQLINYLLTEEYEKEANVNYVKSQLEDIYSDDDYRHRYSDIFATLSRLINNEDNKMTLQMWLEKIKEMEFNAKITNGSYHDSRNICRNNCYF